MQAGIPISQWHGDRDWEPQHMHNATEMGTREPGTCGQGTEDPHAMRTGTGDPSTCRQVTGNHDTMGTRSGDPRTCRQGTKEPSAMGTAHSKRASTRDTLGKAFGDTDPQHNGASQRHHATASPSLSPVGPAKPHQERPKWWKGHFPFPRSHGLPLGATSPLNYLR